MNNIDFFHFLCYYKGNKYKKGDCERHRKKRQKGKKHKTIKKE